MASLKGFRYVIFISVLAAATGLTLYPIIVKPLLNADDYKKFRKFQNWEGYKK